MERVISTICKYREEIFIVSASEHAQGWTWSFLIRGITFNGLSDNYCKQYASALDDAYAEAIQWINGGMSKSVERVH